MGAFYDSYLLNLKFFWIIPEYLIVLITYTAMVDLGIKGYSEATIVKSFLKRLKNWSKWFFGALLFLGLVIGIISNKLSNWPLFRK